MFFIICFSLFLCFMLPEAAESPARKSAATSSKCSLLVSKVSLPTLVFPLSAVRMDADGYSTHWHHRLKLRYLVGSPHRDCSKPRASGLLQPPHGEHKAERAPIIQTQSNIEHDGFDYTQGQINR